MQNITEEIKTQIQGEVSASEQDLEKYSRDASIFEIKPQAVVHPKNIQDLKNLVTWAAKRKQENPLLSLTARSAGTDMSGGAINDSVILDFTTHFNRVVSVKSSEDKPDPYEQIIREHNGQPEGHVLDSSVAGHAIVEPGVFYRDFEKLTLAKNLILPCYTASKSLNTVGGMAANNSAGEKSLSYGQTKDYVEELDVILSDGNEYTFKNLTGHELDQKLKLSNFEGQIYRQMYDLIATNYDLIKKSKPSTSKNSAGYLLWEVWDKINFNLAKLIVGSQGTLGLITRIKFRLVKPKPKSELLVIFLKDLKPLGDVVSAVIKHNPESFESFDDHTFSLAMKFLPDMMKKMSSGAGSASGGALNLIKLGLQFLPEMWMTLTGGIPKLILIAEFTGETEYEARKPLLEAQKEVEEKFHLKTHVTRDEKEAQKYWTVRRESFSLLRQHVKNMHTAPFIDDIVVHPKDLPEFLPRLNEILSKYPKLIYTIAGHAGDANFHIIPLMNLKDESQRMAIPKLSEEVYSLVLEFKGSITAEHNDGLIRTPFLEKMYGPAIYGLFEKTKKIFDPLNIFNPRKKVGATMDYAMKHVKRS